MTDTPNPDDDDATYFLKLAGEFHSQTYHGTVLTMTATLDEGLRQLLLARMRTVSNRLSERLFSGYGPLASFSAKTDVSYALDLIDDGVYGDLKIIREIRNHFAHSLIKTTFSSPEVIASCRKFKIQDADPFVTFWSRVWTCSQLITSKTQLLTAAQLSSDRAEPPA
jgi:DNA-binding MltR family transcriptional regulator